MGVALLVICAGRRGSASRRWLNSPAPLWCRSAGRAVSAVRDPRGGPVGEGGGAALRADTSGCAGPGMFHVIPVVDTLSRYVDQRVRVANVSAESTLTRDTVPVNVDAIVFWMVWNAEKSILEVQDFAQAIMMSAQTALRESIGRHELHQMVAEREIAGPGTAAHSRREDQPVGHHGAVGGDPRRADSAGAAGRDVAAGAGRTRTAGAQHPRAGGDGDRREVRAGRASTYQRQSGGAASARDEHAVRGDQGEGLDGDCAVVGGGDDGAGRDARHGVVGRRQAGSRAGARCAIMVHALDHAHTAIGSDAVAAKDDKQKTTERLDDAAALFSEIMGAPDKSIPQDLLDKSHCIVLVPGLKKGAFVIGGKFGRGFASAAMPTDRAGARRRPSASRAGASGSRSASRRAT